MTRLDLLQSALRVARAARIDPEHAIVRTDDLAYALARIAALEAVAEAAQASVVENRTRGIKPWEDSDAVVTLAAALAALEADHD